jgi:hypothetical protein
MTPLQAASAAAVAVMLGLGTTTAIGQPALVIKPLAEKRIKSLPTEPLFWQIESFPTLMQAQASAGASGLAVESGGKAWLFRLAPRGDRPTEGAKHEAEIGPVSRIAAAEYLLRINEASGPPGSVTSVHTHPGSEAFYVLAGEQSIRTPRGVLRVGVGQGETGQGADVPMQVSSSGTTDLHALVMFVVDAARPFSSPANFP